MRHFSVQMKFAMPEGLQKAEEIEDDALAEVMQALVDRYSGAAIHSDYHERTFTLFVETSAQTRIGAKLKAARIFHERLHSTLPQYKFKALSMPKARKFVPVS